MLGVLRVRGEKDIRPDVRKVFELLGLDRNFTLAVTEDNPSMRGMVKKAKDRAIWGELSAEIVKELDKLPSKGENVKRYRLHPPRGGFRRTLKRPAPRGELGYRDDLAKLISRMLPGGGQ